MNRDVKADWISALESGDYEQGRDQLVSSKSDGNESWCCLGVLCDLALKSGEVSGLSRSGDGFVHSAQGVICYTGMPPGEVLDWADVHVDDAYFLAEMNDALTPFPAIAAYVRRHL